MVGKVAKVMGRQTREVKEQEGMCEKRADASRGRGQKRDRRGRKGPIRSFVRSFIPGMQVEGSGSHDPA